MIHREAVTATQLTSLPKYQTNHSKLLQEHIELLLCITHELNPLRKRNSNRISITIHKEADQFTSPNYQNTNQFLQITHKHVM